MASLNPPSPKRLDELKRDLDEFLNAYVAYLQAGPTQPQPGLIVTSSGDPQARARVIERIPAAERAMDIAGVTPVVTDPPALGAHRQAYAGLSNLAFKHEEPGWRMSGLSGGPELYDHVIDWVGQARAQLDNMAREERRRRRNPLYWLDRAVRILLAIPAYIVSRIVGRSVYEIDRSPWGLLLRVIAVIADGLTIYFAGRIFGFW